MFRLQAAAALFASIACAASAQSRADYMALQYALSNNGVYDSTVDGLAGPATMAAIDIYAAQHSIQPRFWSVADHLSSNISWEVDWTDMFETALTDMLEEYLLDAPSARISERRVFARPDSTGTGSEWYAVCVRVNAKNQFGAYTGYQWLYFPALITRIGSSERVGLHPSLPSLSQTENATWCELGYLFL